MAQKNQAKGSKQRACNYCAFKPTHMSLKVCQFSIKVNKHFRKVIVNNIWLHKGLIVMRVTVVTIRNDFETLLLPVGSLKKET